MKLFWNFKNKLLSGRRRHQFEFSGQVNSMFANSENKSRLPIVQKSGVKIENLWVTIFEAIFSISGVWHVGWWNLVPSVRLIQVGNNRNDHSRYFLGVRVRLIKVLFKVNKGNRFGDFGYCPINRGCPLNTVSA